MTTPDPHTNGASSGERPWYRRRWAIISGVVVLVLVLIIALGAAFGSKKENKPASALGTTTTLAPVATSEPPPTTDPTTTTTTTAVTPPSTAELTQTVETANNGVPTAANVACQVAWLQAHESAATLNGFVGHSETYYIGNRIIQDAIGACPVGLTGPSQATPTTAPSQVTLNVTGTGPATSITISDGLQESQQNSQSLPWSDPIGQPSYAAVAAQNSDGSTSATISCSITRGGQTLTRNTSTGPYAVVTCSTG